MTPINDYNHYRKEMSKGIEDKLFFLDHIQFDNLLDYGCADGFLLHYLSENFGNIQHYLGYDQDENMVRLSNQKEIPNSFFFHNLDFIEPIFERLNGDTAILCSSLIHEIYSYGNDETVEQFWSLLFSGKFKYIIIRDMALSQHTKKQQTDVKDVLLLRQNADNVLLKHFVYEWGDIAKKENFLHFLLKYRYTKNWDREVKENYFPLTVEEFKQKIPHGFKILFEEHYLLPFIKKQVKDDFGISLNDKTHLKMIIERI